MFIKPSLSDQARKKSRWKLRKMSTGTITVHGGSRRNGNRNREAMAERGYTEESFEAWRDGAVSETGIPDYGAEDMDEIVEKKILLGVLEEALDSLMPEERDLLLLVWGEEMSLKDFSEMKGKKVSLRIVEG